MKCLDDCGDESLNLCVIAERFWGERLRKRRTEREEEKGEVSWLIDGINGLDFLGIEWMGVWVMEVVMFVCDCRGRLETEGLEEKAQPRCGCARKLNQFAVREMLVDRVVTRKRGEKRRQAGGLHGRQRRWHGEEKKAPGHFILVAWL